MAEDFRAKVTAELDTAEAESKLNAFLNENRHRDSVPGTDGEDP